MPSDETMAHQFNYVWNHRNICKDSSIEDGNSLYSNVLQFGNLSCDEFCCKNMKQNCLSYVPSWSKRTFVGANLRDKTRKSKQYIDVGSMRVKIVGDASSYTARMVQP